MNKPRDGYKDDGYSLEKPARSVDLFSRFLFLERYRDILKHSTIKDVIGEGQNGIIIQHPDHNDKVIKFAKSGAVDDIKKEYDVHAKFIIALEQGHLQYPGDLSLNVKVPNLDAEFHGDKGYFVMEKIEGQSLASLFYLDEYGDSLSGKYLDSYLRSLSDFQLREIMISEGKDVMPGFALLKYYDI